MCRSSRIAFDFVVPPSYTFSAVQRAPADLGEHAVVGRDFVRNWLNPVLTLPLAKRPLPAVEADVTRWWPVCPLRVKPGSSPSSLRLTGVDLGADIATRNAGY